MGSLKKHKKMAYFTYIFAISVILLLVALVILNVTENSELSNYKQINISACPNILPYDLESVIPKMHYVPIEIKNVTYAKNPLGSEGYVGVSESSYSALNRSADFP